MSFRSTARERPAGWPCALFVVWAVVLPSAAEAQLNVEALATTIKEPGVHGLVSTSLSLEAGNVQLVSVGGSAALVYATEHSDAPEDDSDSFWFRDRFLANGGASFTRTPEARIANQGFAHLRYSRMQWLRIGAEVFFQVQYDEFRLLTRRVVGGGGGRFVLCHFENFAAWMGTGYMAEEEKRNIPPEEQPPLGPDPVGQLNHRWNNYLTLMAMRGSEHVSLANTVYVQPRFDQPADIQILDELSLNATLTDMLALTVGVTFRYDSRAPRIVEEFDVKVTNGITVTF